MELTEREFGNLDDGREVRLFTLKSPEGLTVRITNYGGIVTSLLAPDRDGHRTDVVLGFSELEPYLEDHPYFGAIVGRYANRIANGVFTLDGKRYELACNNPPNHLHGGEKGFDKALWNPEIQGNALVLKYVSEDGEEGYPGRLETQVTYRLTEDRALRIDYRATTDARTIVNMTNHTYFNLEGEERGQILDHEVMINADYFTPVNKHAIPSGEIRQVDGTPMDFREFHRVGERIDEPVKQLEIAGGYDHNYVLNHQSPQDLTIAAKVVAPKTGRILEMRTTEPGVQFYTGNFLEGSYKGKGGNVYSKRSGLCLEAQHYPDSPNHPDFPSTVLEPGEEYRQTTIYRFTTDRRNEQSRE